jgi:DNA topoisomerase-2
MVIDENLVIFKRRRVDIETDLNNLEFDKIDDSYDHLMNIRTYQYTEEAVNKLKHEVEQVSQELVVLEKTTVKQMMISDLEHS